MAASFTFMRFTIHEQIADEKRRQEGGIILNGSRA